MDEKKIRAFFEKDHYAKQTGIVIESFSEGKATCSFEVQEKHLNAVNTVQGGAIFTLADFAFAIAANSMGKRTVSLENQISFMHPARGRKLIAIAYEVTSTQKICFYQVDITDENHQPIARMSVTGYMI